MLLIRRKKFHASGYAIHFDQGLNDCTSFIFQIGIGRANKHLITLDHIQFVSLSLQPRCNSLSVHPVWNTQLNFSVGITCEVRPWSPCTLRRSIAVHSARTSERCPTPTLPRCSPPVSLPAILESVSRFAGR